MATTTADAKKRIVLPSAKPGDVFEVQEAGDGRFVVVRLQRPSPPRQMSRAQCLRAIAAAPLRLRMTWDELRTQTREP